MMSLICAGSMRTGLSFATPHENCACLPWYKRISYVDGSHGQPTGVSGGIWESWHLTDTHTPQENCSGQVTIYMEGPVCRGHP
jgi:hypothetical protein